MLIVLHGNTLLFTRYEKQLMHEIQNLKQESCRGWMGAVVCTGFQRLGVGAGDWATLFPTTDLGRGMNLYGRASGE